MRSSLLRWLFVLLAVIAMVAGNVLWAYATRPSKGYAEIRNQTGETISQVEITVCKSQFLFRDLPGNAQVGFSYPINCDSGYEIDARLSSGKRVQAKLGYVTHGLDSSDALTITASDVDLTRLPAGH